MTDEYIMTLDYLGIGYFTSQITQGLITAGHEPLEILRHAGLLIAGNIGARVNWTSIEFAIDLERRPSEGFTHLMLTHPFEATCDLAASREYLDNVQHSAGYMEMRLTLERPPLHHHCLGNLDPEQVAVWRILGAITELENLIRHRCLQHLTTTTS